jgi:hypothetical protein
MLWTVFSCQKLGPMHMWTDVPLSSIQVYMRFLEPIMPHEASTREEMAVLVRRRMLQSFLDVPADVAAELTWPQRLACWGCVASVYAATYCLYRFVPYGTLRVKYGISVLQAWGVWLVLSVVLTLLFYAYAVYCAPAVRRMYATTREKVNKVAKKLKSKGE